MPKKNLSLRLDLAYEGLYARCKTLLEINSEEDNCLTKDFIIKTLEESVNEINKLNTLCDKNV